MYIFQEFVRRYYALFSKYSFSVRTHVPEGICIPLVVKHELSKHCLFKCRLPNCNIMTGIAPHAYACANVHCAQSLNCAQDYAYVKCLCYCAYNTWDLGWPWRVLFRMTTLNHLSSVSRLTKVSLVTTPA